MLSLGGTLASWTVLLAGAAVGHGDNAAVPIGAIGTVLAPSFGHWYASEGMSRGLGIRLLGLGILVFDTYVGLQCSEDCNFGPTLKGSLYVGIGLYLAGTLDDIATAGSAAQAATQRRNVTLVPMIRRDASGLMLTGRF